jgi:hypothetical protein
MGGQLSCFRKHPYLGSMTAQEAIGIARKWLNEAITGNMSDAEFEDYFNVAQIEDATWLIGKMQGYSSGAPEPPVGLALTRTVALALAHLRVPDYVVTLTKGKGTFDPGDLMHGPLLVAASGYVNACGETVEIKKLIAIDQMNDDEWSRRTMSYNNRPTRKNPIWRYSNGTIIEVSPLSINMVEIAYYRKPPKISVANNTNITWWHDTDVIRILGRALQQAGLNLTDEMAMNFGKQIERNPS